MSRRRKERKRRRDGHCIKNAPGASNVPGTYMVGCVKKVFLTASASPLYRRYGGAERGGGDKILCAVEHQRIGNAVSLGVFHHIALKKAEVKHMDFRIVLHRKLSKRVVITNAVKICVITHILQR